jgi:hypothetical protein
MYDPKLFRISFLLEPGLAFCQRITAGCRRISPPRVRGYGALVLILIIIVLRAHYATDTAVPVMVILGGTGLTVSTQASWRLAHPARLLP